MKPVHSANEDLANEVAMLAEERGLVARVNQTNSPYNPFCGFHRYVLLRPGVSNDYSCRSRGCVKYTEAPHSRYSRPSVSGERQALTWLLHYLQEAQNG